METPSDICRQLKMKETAEIAHLTTIVTASPQSENRIANPDMAVGTARRGGLKYVASFIFPQLRINNICRSVMRVNPNATAAKSAKLNAIISETWILFVFCLHPEAQY